MSNTIKHTLLKPISFGDNKITTIEIKEPSYKHLKHCNLNDGQSVINTILEKCNDLPDNLLDDLSSKDYFKLLEMISDSDFLV